MNSNSDSTPPENSDAIAKDKNPFTQGPEITNVTRRREDSSSYAAPGELVNALPKRYRVERRLGRGGMGQVFLATDVGDLGLGTRQVALKVILENLASQPTTYQRFVQEMHIAEQLDHENIVQVLTHGMTDNGLPYLVMQYVEGGSLLDYIKRRGPLSVVEAIDLTQQLCTALMVAHDAGVIHRDIKPSNILIREERYPRQRIVAKLADFGLARSLTTPLHSSSAQAGTFGYRAPEQRRGQQVDARSDLYSLGATLFHALTGDVPEGIVDWEEIPELIRPLLHRSLSKRPIDRFSNARDMYNALESSRHTPKSSSILGSSKKPKVIANPHETQPETKMPPIEASPFKAAPGGGPPAKSPAKRKAIALPEILTNSLGMQFRLIRPGAFMMGHRERGQRQMTIKQPFYIGIYPITQNEYERLMGCNPSLFKGEFHPVERVSWEDTSQFIDKLNTLAAEISAGRSYRRPKEAEWEYACRAGSKTAYCFGDSIDRLAKHGWYAENSGGKTHAVGKKLPNSWGLYDMHGNVWEWCDDWYREYSEASVTEADGSTGGPYRVYRGGSWDVEAASCESASRHRRHPAIRYHDLGFRLALSLTNTES